MWERDDVPFSYAKPTIVPLTKPGMVSCLFALLMRVSAWHITNVSDSYIIVRDTTGQRWRIDARLMTEEEE